MARALRKGHASAFNITRDIRGKGRIVERALDHDLQRSPSSNVDCFAEWWDRMQALPSFKATQP